MPSSPERAEVMQHWLGAISAEASERGFGPPPDPDDRPRVDAHLASALCPAQRLAPGEEFRDSARVWARSIGLEALRRHAAGRADAPRDPVAEVTDVMGESTAHAPGLGMWLDQIDRAESAAVAAAAVSWMVDALALAARHGEPLWHSPTARMRDLPSPRVRVSARVDAVRETTSGTHLLVVAPRPQGTDARLARRVALVSAVANGEVPLQVHIGHRETLTRHSHPIGGAEFDRAVSEVADDIGWKLEPSSAPRVPGAGCRWCPLADDCPEGTAHLVATRGAPAPLWLVDERGPGHSPGP